MLRSAALCVALGLAGGVVMAAETHPFSVHDMVAMDRISDPRVSPDGRLVAFVVRVTDLAANKGRNDIWLAAVDGSSPRRLTTSDASDTQPRFSPDGKSLYFVSTRSGSAQVWRISLAGGEAEQATSLPLDVDAVEIAPTGSYLVLAMAVFPGASPDATKARSDEKDKTAASGMLFDRLFVRHWDSWSDGTRNHLFACDLASGKVTDLMPAMDADCPSKPFGDSADYTIAPNGATIVFSARDVGREEAWSTNFDLFTVPADGSAPPRKLTTSPATDSQPRFSPDGALLAYLAMSRPGYEADRYEIVVRELTTGKERTHTLKTGPGKRDDRSPADLAWSRDGRELYCTADHLGQHALFAIDPASGKARMVAGHGTTGSPQDVMGGRILYTMHSLQGPTELWLVDRDGEDARPLTHFNDARLAAARRGTEEQFSFTGAKGDEVWGYLVKPVDFDPTRKVPVAFLIHGGPQGSFGNDFHYRWNPQAYAGAGYAAVMIDFHGSTGYGQSFTDAINGDWGGAPLEDLLKGLDYALQRYPFLDGSRVAALGASYGGYMVNWLAGKAPERFRCFVCHDGNLDERFAYYDTEELWFPEWEHGGVPWGSEGFAKHNPIDLIARWQTPMLVVHGMKDFRIPYSQGLATFTALQRRGIPSQLLVFPDENHWVLKPANSIQWHGTVLAWLERWLRG